MSVATPPVWTDPSTTAVDVATNGIWNQTATDAVASDLYALGGSDGSSGVAGKGNILINGGFEIWQRGNGPYTANSAYTSDRWQINLGASSTISVALSAGVVDTGSGASAACTYIHSSASSLQQKLEDLNQLKGRTISLNMRVNTATATGARAWLSGDGGATKTYSAYHTGGSTWQTLTVAGYAVSPSATAVLGGVEFAVSGTYYLDNAMLVYSIAPMAYVPLPFDMDLMRCMRYYESWGFIGSTNLALHCWAGATGSYGMQICFKAKKFATPTITISGTWNVTNCGQPVANNPNQDSFELAAAASGAGAMAFFANTTAMGFTAESNP
jgi:hypothetical protein